MIVKVTALCVAAAMICAALRMHSPEMATALSLATGLTVLAMLWGEFSWTSDWARLLEETAELGNGLSGVVLRGAGIAVVSEFGAQLCADAGESALAGRVTLASKIAMLGLCAPLLTELMGLLDGTLS